MKHTPIAIAASVVALLAAPALPGCFLYGLGDEDAYDHHLNIELPFDTELDDSLWKDQGNAAGMESGRPLYVPVELTQRLDLRDLDLVDQYADSIAGVVIKDATFSVDENTLDLGLEPIELYLGPPAGKDQPIVLDGRFRLLGRTSAIGARQTLGKSSLEDFAIDYQGLTELLSGLSCSAVARSGLVLPAGQVRLPQGHATVAAALNLILIVRPQQ